MNSHAQAIIDAVHEIAEVPDGIVVNGETRFEADLGFDSGNFIELFLVLEETIAGFTLGSARLAPEDFLTVDRLADFVVRRMTEVEQAA